MKLQPRKPKSEYTGGKMINTSYVPMCQGKWVASESISQEARIARRIAMAKSEEEKDSLRKSIPEIFRPLYKQSVNGFEAILCDMEARLNGIAPDANKVYQKVNAQYSNKLARQKQRLQE
jgi:hypothetical protein